MLNRIIDFVENVFVKRRNNYLRKFNFPVKYNKKFGKEWSWKTSERIVEHPFVLKNISEDRRYSILDFGCAKSLLPLQLASLGHNVIGVDLRDYEFKHKNFKFFKGNLLDYKLEYKFDYIISISVLEHIENLTPIMEYFYYALRGNGKLIITVPMGDWREETDFKIFSIENINTLFYAYNTLKERFFGYYKRVWIPTLYHKSKKLVGCFVFQKI